MSNNHKNLHVYSRHPGKKKIEADDFVIESEITSASDSAHMVPLASLTEYVNNTENSFPMSKGLLPYLVSPRYAGLPILVIIYRQLEKHIKNNEYTRIICHDLDDSHKAVVSDVAEATKTDLSDNSNSGKRSSPSDILSFGLITFLLDQLLSILFSPIQYQRSKPDLMLFTSSGRNRNESLVINELSLNVTVVTSLWRTTWLRRDYETDYNEDVSLRPLHSYSSVWAVYKQLKMIGSLTIQSIRGIWKIESGINDHLNGDLGVEMPQSVHYSCTIATSNAIQQILSYYVVVEALGKENPSKVMVRGGSVRPRLVLAAASDRGIDLYYLPHSITKGYEKNPAEENVTRFMPGNYEIEYLKQSELNDSLPELIPTGRPIHEEYKQNKNEPDPSTSEPITVLIATQPYENRDRERFIEVILAGLSELPVKYNAIIKIHPSEDPSFYQEHFDEYLDKETVVIETGDIEPYLEKADLTITINSNVGFESMIGGTGLIVYNEWAPRKSIFPYAKLDSVPVAQSETEFRKIISSLDLDEIKELGSRQKQDIDDAYIFNNTVDTITETIEE